MDYREVVTEPRVRFWNSPSRLFLILFGGDAEVLVRALLTDGGKSFTFDPLPDDLYEIGLKDEFGLIVWVEKVLGVGRHEWERHV